MTPQEQLRAAADLIEREGWWNPRLSLSGSNNNCPVTAFQKLYANNPEGYLPARKALEAYVGTYNIPEWNDKQTEARVVIEALRKCADGLDARGEQA